MGCKSVPETPSAKTPSPDTAVEDGLELGLGQLSI